MGKLKDRLNQPGMAEKLDAARKLVDAEDEIAALRAENERMRELLRSGVSLHESECQAPEDCAFTIGARKELANRQTRTKPRVTDHLPCVCAQKPAHRNASECNDRARAALAEPAAADTWTDAEIAKAKEVADSMNEVFGKPAPAAEAEKAEEK